jgi:hypothetical protein
MVTDSYSCTVRDRFETIEDPLTLSRAFAAELWQIAPNFERIVSGLLSIPHVPEC